MARNKLRTQLGIECLERRDTPAFLGPVGIFDGGVLVQDFDQYGSISLTNGSVKVVGTGWNDIIRVDKYEPVLSQFKTFSSGGIETSFGDQIVVTITDSQGNIRTDALGNHLRRYFSESSVNLVEANALGGHDRTINTTSKTMVHLGGSGNDTLIGGKAMDVLNGGDGDDWLYGGDGQDQLYGATGNDRLYGDAGNDYMTGGDGNDTLFGGTGNDVMHGEGGADFAFGNQGDDSIYGGDGNDTLLGESGKDVLRGENGNDLLSGGSENDVLYGNAGDDDLQGFEGNDGLFGGSGKDTLNGGSGIDRFLKWEGTGNNTTIEGKKSNESITVFKDTTSVQTFTNQGSTLRYQPKAWMESEIEQIDIGLAFMHSEAGNTRLLRRSNGGNVTMNRFGNYIPYNAMDGNNDENDRKANAAGPGFTGFNKGDGRIYFNDGTFSGGDRAVASTAIHELAHNWDDENDRYSEWKSISGWVSSTNPNSNQTLSGDGKWVHNTNAEFARSYGKTNPKEDFTTSFEAYYALKTGDLSYSELVRLTPKLNFIGLFITRISG